MITSKTTEPEGGIGGGLVAAMEKAHKTNPKVIPLPKGFIEHEKATPSVVEAVAHAPCEAELAANSTPLFRTRAAR